MPDVTAQEYCPSCGLQIDPDRTFPVTLHPVGEEDGQVALETHCSNCCTTCEHYGCQVHGSLAYSETDDSYYCEDHHRYCPNCGNEPVGLDTSRCWDCRDEYDDDDYEDSPVSLGTPSFVSYSYKPDPNFHGDGPLYMGVEHEMEFERGSGRDAVMQLAAELAPDLFYFKHDSSLTRNGCEFITHPMSPDYAINEYPHDVVRAMAANGGIPDDNAGIHIHLSRAGFATSYHMWKFLHFHYANPVFVKALAGRDSHWAQFTSRSAPRRMTKGGAVDLMVSDVSLADMARKYKRGGDAVYERYLAVNVQNAATIELRYFSSTVDPEVLRGYFDYVKALFEFTRIAKVRNRANPSKALSGLAFRQWAEASGDYPHFMRLLSIRSINPSVSLGPVESAPFPGKEQ